MIQRLYCQQIRAFLRQISHMDHDFHNLNEFLVDQESFHFPPSTQDKTFRKLSIQFKQPQQLISPANIPIINRHFMMLQSPSPFKQPVNFYEQQQSDSHNPRQNFALEQNRAEIHTLVNFDESPKKRGYQPYYSNTASSLRISSKIPQIKAINFSSKEEKRNSKGLRNLSQSVFKIVLDLKVTTYKQVADHLVRMLNAGIFGPCDQDFSKTKDQQNIKRRVYDALNVLISADVLKKNGKFVMSQQDAISEKLKSSSKNGKKQDKDNLYEQIIKKQSSIRDKKIKIEELKRKKQILNAILKRNRKKKLMQKQKILFPLIGVTFKKTIPKINRNQQHSKISFPLQNSLQVIGDMDLLTKIGIDLLNQNIQQIIQDVNQEQIEAEVMKQKVKIENSHPSGRQRISKILYSL